MQAKYFPLDDFSSAALATILPISGEAFLLPDSYKGSDGGLVMVAQLIFGEINDSLHHTLF